MLLFRTETGDSGDTPVFIWIVTACHRIGAGEAGCGRGLRLVAGVDCPAIPGSKIGELVGLDDVAPAAAVADAQLLADDPERVHEAGEPAGALEPVPPWPGPEGLEQVGRSDGLAFPFADGL